MEENKKSDDFKKEIYDIQTWQKIHVQQLSYTRNILIVLALATLGFTLKMLGPDLGSTYSLLFKIIALSLLASIVIGLFISFYESENYRIKYRISRNVFRSKPYDSDEQTCTNLEIRNKCLLLLESILFGLAILVETVILIIK